MARFDLMCFDCEKRSEVIQSGYAPVPKCEKCGGKQRKVYDGPNRKPANLGTWLFEAQQFVKEDDTFGVADKIKGTSMATVPRNFGG
ncbi:MAG: hypothetical protein GY700_06320 [Propionibacteriaceae bacterium]|nr:hypothetical protein [Propionibacteriaceae bacterium]